MAKRKLNKNLVAALTVSGMLLAVTAVAVISFNLAGLDPQTYVDKALEREESGDWLRAAEYYRRAFRADRQPKYLIEASRCAYQLGDVNATLRILNEALTLAPKDTDVLEAMLDKLWELRTQFPVDDMLREHSAMLLEIEPDNLLGLVCQAEGHGSGSAGADPAVAEAAIAKAIQLDATDPRVAIARRSAAVRKMRELLLSQPPGRVSPEVTAQISVLQDGSLEALREAWDKHPEHLNLTEELSRALASMDWIEEARGVLEKAIELDPSRPELHQLLAVNLWQLAARERSSPAPDAAKIAEYVSVGKRAAEKAIELDSALYDAYAVLAQLSVFDVSKGNLSAEDAQRYEAALALCHKGLESNVGVRSLRAMLAERAGRRAALMASGFELAMQYRARAPEASQRDEALKHARRFVDLSVTQYPTYYMTAVLEGELAVFENDPRAAVTAFQTADEKTRGIRGLEAVNRLAKERLAMLYRQLGEPGLAMDYTERAIEAYQRAREAVPLGLWEGKVDLLMRFGKNDEALTLLDGLISDHPDYEPFRRARAAVLVALGRGEEAEKSLGEVREDDPRDLMMRAQLAATGENWQEAENLLRKLIERNPRDRAALGLLANVMNRAGRGADGARFFGELREREMDETHQRLLRAYEVTVGIADAAERDEKLREVIESIPDEANRAAELFSFYYTRERYEESAPHLARLEQLRPNDAGVLEQQFLLHLRLSKFKEAEAYALRLAEKNADSANGAVFRGQLKAAQRDFEGALTEFRAAERLLPNDSNLKVRIAQAMLALPEPRLQESIPVLQQAVQFDPLNFQANRMLYAVYEQLGRPNEGVPYLRAAARLNPEDEFVKQRQRFLEEESDPAAGVAQREKLREENPQDVENLLRLVQLYTELIARTESAQQRAAYFEKGEQRLGEIVALEPKRVGLPQIAATFYAAAGKRAEGEAFLRESIARLETVYSLETQVVLARFLEQFGDLPAAQAEFLLAIQQIDKVLTDPEQRQRAHVLLGQDLVDFYARTDQVDALIDAADKLLSQTNEDAVVQSVQLKVAQTLMRTSRFGKAREALDRYDERFPKDLRSSLLRAQLLLSEPAPSPEKRTTQLDQARELLSAVLTANPDEPFALFLRGALNMELAQNFGQKQAIQSAREDLLRAKQLAPLSYNLRHRLALAQLYEYSGQPELAENELKELVDAAPNDANVLNRLMLFYRTTGHSQRAQEFVAARAAREPDNPFWSHQLGRLMMENGSHSAAVSPLQSALAAYERIGRRNPLILIDLLQALVRGSRQLEAIQFFESLPAEEATPSVRATVSEAYLSSGQREKGIALLTAALADSTRTGPADMTLVARQVAGLLPVDAARGVFEQVLRDTAKEAGGLTLQSLYAGYLVQRGGPEAHADAERMLDEVIAKANRGTAAQLNALVSKARLQDAQGRHADAVKTYERVLEIEQNHLEALNNLAYSLAARLDRAAEALPYVERLSGVASRASDSGAIDRTMYVSVLDTIGWVYFLNDRSGPAEQALLEALRLEPNDVAARFHLGRIYMKAGRTSEARAALRAAREQAEKIKDDLYIKDIEQALAELR